MALSPEQIDHINLVNWFNYKYPEYEDDLHHFANERKCSVMQGRILKRMAVKKGVSDFFLAIPKKELSGFWLELKIGKNKPTKEQILFAERKRERGYKVEFAWGFDEAKQKIMDYLS